MFESKDSSQIALLYALTLPLALTTVPQGSRTGSSAFAPHTVPCTNHPPVPFAHSRLPEILNLRVWSFR
jgi:hypothetical protein